MKKGRQNCGRVSAIKDYKTCFKIHIITFVSKYKDINESTVLNLQRIKKKVAQPIW